MKHAVIIALIALALATPATAQRQASPACSRVITSGYIHNGQYAGVNCPENRLIVSLRPGQALPARGAARTSGTLLLASNGAYPVVGK